MENAGPFNREEAAHFMIQQARLLMKDFSDG
jgi:hypothetical protein